jgi:hypothetical protein
VEALGVEPTVGSGAKVGTASGASDGVAAGSVGSDTGVGVPAEPPVGLEAGAWEEPSDTGAWEEPSVGLALGAGNELPVGSCTGVPVLGSETGIVEGSIAGAVDPPPETGACEDDPSLGADTGAWDDPSVGLSFGAGNELPVGACTGVLGSKTGISEGCAAGVDPSETGA